MAETPALHVEQIPVADLHEDPANVRRHPERNLAAIKASLARFGQQKPVVIDANNVVRAGNGTLAAARELGWDTLACVRTDLSGVEATAYAIADNRTAEIAEWDEVGLAETLRALQSEDFDLDAVGYTEDEVNRLIDDLAGEIAGNADAVETPFSDFAPSGADDGFVPFKFGNYSGRVSQEVYDSFVAAHKKKQAESGEPMLDDVLRAWLDV